MTDSHTSAPAELPWHPIEYAGWSALANELIIKPMTAERRMAALKWLGEVAAAEQRREKRIEIVRTIEDNVLSILKFARRENWDTKGISVILARLQVPLSHPDLLGLTNYTWRRLVSFVAGHDGGYVTKSYTMRDEKGVEYDVSVEEKQEEEVAANVFLQALGRIGDAIRTIRPTAIDFDWHPDGFPEGAFVPVQCSAFVLALLDDERIRKELFYYLIGTLTLLDPPLSLKISALMPRLIAEGDLDRRTAIQEFSYAVLESTIFNLQRDFGHGLKRLRLNSLEELDAYANPNDPRLVDLKEEYNEAKVFMSGRALQVPLSAINGTSLLRISSDNVEEALSGVREGFKQLEQTGRALSDSLRTMAWRVVYEPDVFESLWHLFTLLVATSEGKGASIEFEWNGQPILAAEWTRQYLSALLIRSTETFATNESSMHIVSIGETRAVVHSQVMCAAAWVVASPDHLRAMRDEEKSERDQQADSLADENQQLHDVDASVIFRTLFLTGRLLPLVTSDLGLSTYELRSFLEGVAGRIRLPQWGDSWPDLLNPFLYGPDKYDHERAALIYLLISVWNYLPMEDGHPHWWSPEIEEALHTISGYDLTDEEEELVKAESRGVPNRLGIGLTRPLPQLANQLIALAAATE